MNDDKPRYYVVRAAHLRNRSIISIDRELCEVMGDDLYLNVPGILVDGARSPLPSRVEHEHDTGASNPRPFARKGEWAETVEDAMKLVRAAASRRLPRMMGEARRLARIANKVEDVPVKVGEPYEEEIP